MPRQHTTAQYGQYANPVAPSTSNRTTILILKRLANSGGSTAAAFTMLNGSGAFVNTVGFSGTDKPLTTSAGLDKVPSVMTVTTSDGWVALGVTKAAGTVAPRFHKYVYSTGVATHEDATATDSDASGTAGSVLVGRVNVAGSSPSTASVAAIARYGRVLTDVEFESAVQDLMALQTAPSLENLWVFDGAAPQSRAAASTVTTDTMTDDGGGSPFGYGQSALYGGTYTQPVDVAPTYNADLSRVVLAITGDALYSYYTVERSTDGTTWETVRGGGEVSRAGTYTLVSDFEFDAGVLTQYRVRAYSASDVLLSTDTATITPAPSGVWLKSPARPFLNREVTVVGFSDVTRPARGGVLDVVGRSLGVAITEVRRARQYELVLRASTADEREAIETMLSFGDVLYVQPPDADCVVPGALYAYVGDVTTARVGKHDGQVRYITLPLVEVAAPTGDIVGYSITWAGVQGTWATWGTLLADVLVPTWLHVQSYVSSPDDEITA